jgi:APA family basic amino acid/polyamine antiporter
VRESRRRLPRVFLGGLVGTAVAYVAMSVVAFGALPGERLQASPAPMAEAAGQYLHSAAWFVTLGAVMALATSVNATMLVPSRLALVLVRDSLAPRWMGAVSPRTGTPLRGLALTLAISVALVLSGQVSLALNIAVFALVALYLLHSLALLLLPRRNPELFASAQARIPLWVQRTAGVVSIACMAGLLAIQVVADVAVLRTTTIRERLYRHGVTTVELAIAWALLGLLLYSLARRSRSGA